MIHRSSWLAWSIWSVMMVTAFGLGALVRSASVEGAQDQPSLLSRVFESAGQNPSSDLSAKAWGTFSKTPDTPFEDIYLFTLQTATERPSKEALAALDRYESNYNEKELSAILFGQDIDLIQEKVGSSQQAVISAELSRLKGAYEDELALQNSTFTLDQQAFAQDMFFNNDLKDSGNVDILVDLSLIYKLFFGKNLDLPDRGNGDVALSSEDDVFEPDFESALPITLASIESDLSCFSDPQLTEALQEFENLVSGAGAEETTENPLDTPESDIRSTAPVVTDSDGSVTLFGAAPSVQEDENDPVLNALNDPTPTSLSAFSGLIDQYAATKGDWTRALPCGKVFCLEVNLVKETLGTKNPDDDIPYSPTDSCIACHLSYIYARMEKTLAKPLAPGKVSSNFFEDGTCKDSGNKVNLDLNIYTYPKPIVLDPGEDTVSVPDTMASDLSSELTALGALPDEREDYVNAAAQVACERQRDYQNVVGHVDSLSTALEACNTSSALVQEEIQNTFDSYLSQLAANQDGLLVEELTSQLNQMLSYVEAMSQFLQETAEGDHAPLAEAASKPYCE